MGVRFGPYRLERLLGKGGMGEVWLAATSTGHRVAVKMLAAEHAADSGYRARFEREAELAAALSDPHIVPIHAHGAIDGRLFIEMAFLEGTDLSTRLAKGPLPIAAAVDIVGQIAGALDTAHGIGLVHRDIKPSNILVRPDGFAYLIDFGLARSLGASTLTATGMAIGTLAYMAPERFTGTGDARSDTYSLACVLYECLTGVRPFGDTDAARQMHAHLMSAPPRAAHHNSAIPTALDEVILRGLAKDPAARHRTAGAFATAATRALTSEHPPTHAATVAARPVPTRAESVVAGPVPTRAESVVAGPMPTKVQTVVSGSMPSSALPVVQRGGLGAGRRWYLRRRGAVAGAGGVVSARSGPVWAPAPVRRQVLPSRGPGYRVPARPAPRRRKGGFLRKLFWMLIVLFVLPLGVAAGCFALVASSTDQTGGVTANPPGVAEPAAEPEVAPAGTPVRDGKFEFAVTEVESGVRKIGSQTAAGSFLVVTVTVRNISDEQKWFTPFGQKLVDTAGNRIDPHLLATYMRGNGKHRNTIQLNPGESATGKLVFDVPNAATPSHLVLHDFPLSGGVEVALY
ncbi:serine/threonine-protein kinase [Nocardia sp. NPDC127579]|uniref:serine/threonine-protein kinase n=1 Tax=Nocardia sp. NPDC127579 TaxID=3345402 RepID=UPI0036402AEE